MQGKGKKLGKEERARRFTKWFWTILCIPVGIFLVLLVLTASGSFGRLPSFEGARKPEEQPGYGDICGRRPSARFVLHTEQVVCRLRGAVARPRRRPRRHRGCPLLRPFGHRFHFARPCGGEDARVRQPQSGGRQRHHAAAPPKTSFRATPPFTAIRSCAADGWSSPSSRSG